MTHPPRVEHSPLPWIAEDMCIKQADGKVVMHLEDFYPSDAAFIVEACNAYEANQKALQVAVDAMENILKHEFIEGGDSLYLFEICQEEAEEALERIREITKGNDHV